jgi:thiol-disulfide isomerase/thioredoxin
MPKLTLFIQERCPFCRKALAYMEELQQQPDYKDIEIEIIDENIQKELADSYDYFYVPTFYEGNRKLHEGAIYKNELEELFKSVLK